MRQVMSPRVLNIRLTFYEYTKINQELILGYREYDAGSDNFGLSSSSTGTSFSKFYLLSGRSCKLSRPIELPLAVPRY
jgi:hypothetical protein